MNNRYLNRRFLSLLLVNIVITSLFSNQLPGEAKKAPPVVSCSWLSENLSDTSLVILHVAQVKLDYENGHIPGARFLWPGYITVSTEKESVISAPAEEIAKHLEVLGVSSHSHVILCGILGNIIPVARVFVNLEHTGLRGKVSILDGGFEAWKAAGKQVSTETPVVRKGKFIPSINENLVDAGWTAKNLLNNSYCIIDARPKTVYDGSTGLPRPGHIPGAKNLPVTELYDSKTFQFADAGKIAEAFAKLNIPAGAKPVFYCHTGNSASVAYVAALIAGYDPIIYDGSMEEWSSRFDLPIEKD